MNIAAMLRPTQVAPYSHMTSSSSPPSQASFHQRLPSITHVTSALQQQQPLQPLPAHNVHQELQPLSAHNMHQHAQIVSQSLSSLPPPRHVPGPPARIDSLSSVDSSTQGSLECNSQPLAPSSLHRTRKDSTTHRDPSASSSHTNQHPRRRPGGQTKAACLPCRKRKSKCDGGRPSCKCCTAKATVCNYSVTTPGVTQQQAVKNELDAYKRVLTLIRESNPTDAESMVKIIKERDSLSDAVLFIHASATRQNHNGRV